jgi:hypothetical protein
VTTVAPQQRVGDAEREQAMSHLAQHYADGRLEHEEYAERLDAIWTARTRQDLALLFDDLPREVAPVRPASPAVAARGRRPIPWLPVLAILIGLSILLEGAPVWVAIFFLPSFNRRWAGHPGFAGHGCGSPMSHGYRR